MERLFAREWRETLARAQLARLPEALRAAGVPTPTCHGLSDANASAREFVQNLMVSSPAVGLALDWLGVPEALRRGILDRWNQMEHPSLEAYAPYAAFVLRVEVFFGFALAAARLSAQRPSNLVDIAYLFYLPFCMLFVSSDRLHQATAPLLIREDQSFVWGPELKAALRDINSHFSHLPEAEKRRGVMALGQSLPQGAPSLLTGLWDRHLPRWRLASGRSIANDGDTSEGIAAKIARVSNAPDARFDATSFQPDSVGSAVIRRRISRTKGSWHQLPADGAQ